MIKGLFCAGVSSLLNLVELKEASLEAREPNLNAYSDFYEVLQIAFFEMFQHLLQFLEPAGTGGVDEADETR
jgi:hypothetical protein